MYTSTMLLSTAVAVLTMSSEKVSSESVVIASSKKVAKRIKDLLADDGIDVKTAISNRGLVLQLNLGGAQDTTLGGKLFRQARARLSEIKGPTEVNKRARRLAVAAGLPKATWGQAASGLSPAAIAKLRRWQPPRVSTSQADVAPRQSSLLTDTDTLP